MRWGFFGRGVVVGCAVVVAGLTVASWQQSRPKGTVLLFLSTDCPVALRYSPRIQALHQTYAPQGFTFKALFPNDLESRALIQRKMSERGLMFDWALDLGAERAKAEGITHIPTIVIKDAAGRKVYQGALDDHKDPTLVKNAYASNTLAALARGERLPLRKTDAFGCLLMPSAKPPTEAKVNYAEHVAPILNASCVSCHRPGEVAPFSLIGYAEARKWSPMIAAVTASRKMPPWKAVEGYGDFHGEARLSETEIETLQRWARAGAPRGDAKKEPKPPTFASEWSAGTPDLILQPRTTYRVEADGPDEYRHFILKTDFKETRYVTMMDVKPGNPRVVHHVIAFLDETGASEKLEAAVKDGKEGYPAFGSPGFLPQGSFGGWAPGLKPVPTTPGTAFELKPGTRIVMQVHYHRTGKVEMDRTRIGLYFADAKPERTMRLMWAAKLNLRIPANEARHREVLRIPVPRNVTVHSVMPHMHLLGREMKAWVELPDGGKLPLVHIDDWDFNWQLQYAFRQPVKLPRGSTLVVESLFDNSTGNPNNPNEPPKEVRWGEETTDEMLLLVLSYTVD